MAEPEGIRAKAVGAELEREAARCERRMAGAGALLRAGHADAADLCLALHDWAQALRILTAIAPAIGLVSGLNASYVSLQNRALPAGVRRELAELESRIILRLNGLSIRRAEFELHDALLAGRIEGIARRTRETASD